MSDNKQIDLARTLVETTDAHIFLTGKAGTGKTTFLRRLRRDSPKRMVVLAPTGIAAINAGGMTIHSFFQLSFSPYIPDSGSVQSDFNLRASKLRVIRTMDLLVIDEISMVRADLLDAIDNALRIHRRSNLPFGGVQLLLIGDLQQLAPVVREETWNLLRSYYDTPFFFSSRALQQTHYVTIELQKVYRQSDDRFLSLLNNIREGHADADTLAALNSRCRPDFVPDKKDGYIRLVTHNSQAQQINQAELDQLPGKEYVYEAEVQGKFPEMSYPTEKTLTLKLGAQVMFIKNDSSSEKRYYNGLLGEVTAISDKGFKVRPHGASDEGVIDVGREQWNNTRYVIDEKTQEIREEIEGSFIQYPVKLAWAITIHKSQGLTFDRVMIDASLSFAHGQTYVALSRCKTLEGIVLMAPLSDRAVITDNHVTAFNSDMRCHQPTEGDLAALQQTYGLHLLNDLFTFARERAYFATVVRIMEESLYKTYPRTLAAYRDMLRRFDLNVMNVSSRFAKQYGQMLADEGSKGEALQERIKAGAGYFEKQLLSFEGAPATSDLEIDNAEVRKRLNRAMTELSQALSRHRRLLALIAQSGFDTTSYLNERARVELEEVPQPATSKDKNAEKAASAKKKAEQKPQYTVPEEVKHAMLYNRLREWRQQKVTESGKPAYVFLQTKAMICIANYLPADERELLAIPYFGRKSYDLYGQELLEMVKQYKEQAPDGTDEKPVDVSALTGRAGETTFDTTLRLFKQGLSPEEIAREREVSVSTVMTHLTKFVKEGELSVEAIMPRDHYERIEAYCDEHPLQPETTLTQLRLAVGEDISYEELRSALIVLGLRE